MEEARKKSRICCIVSCETQCSQKETNQRTLFMVPKDPKKRKIWLNAMSPYLKTGRSFRKHLYVCDLHFKNGDVHRKLSNVLKDGSIHYITRQHFRLKPDSVPCIFNEQQLEVKIEIPDDNDQPIVENPSTNIWMPEMENPDIKKEYDIESLENDLHEAMECNIMSRAWGFEKRFLGIFMYYYGENVLYATKTILVKDDMTTEIRVQGKIVNLNTLEKISCSEDILSLMTAISKIYPCRGADEDSSCSKGFFESATRPTTDRCIACRVDRKRKHDRKAMSVKLIDFKRSENEKLIKYLKQKCSQLEKDLATAGANIKELNVKCPSSSTSNSIATSCSSDHWDKCKACKCI